MNHLQFIIQLSKGLIREHRMRRWTMFYALLLTLVMIFLGATFLWTVLRDRPVAFLIYWGVCAWITLLVVLLALYDLAKVRSDARRQRRRLEAEYLAQEIRDLHHDSDSH